MYNITQRADKKWHIDLDLGNGKRRHIKRDTQQEVKDEIKRVLDEIKESATGEIPKEIETVGQWLTYWLEHHIKPKSWKTWSGYRSIVQAHLIPELGTLRLSGRKNVITAEDVERMYTRLRSAKGVGRRGEGYAKAYIKQIHVILSAALTKAWKRGRMTRNIMATVDKPTAPKPRIKAHRLDQVQAIIQAAMADRNAARWLVGIMLGLRQGEVLGLRWSRVYLDARQPYLEVEKQVGRQTWEHGCDDPVACVVKWGKCKKKPCPQAYEHGCKEGFDPCPDKKPDWRCPDRRPRSCRKHTRPCPEPCPPGCTDHARWCPDRINGGLVEKDVKSESGVREVDLPEVVAEALIKIRERQQKYAKPGAWSKTWRVFGRPDGSPVDPKVDHAAWETLLAAAGQEDVELHRARHDAGTLLVATGTDIRVVQKIMGHSRITVTEGYVDVASDLKREAVDRVAAALFDGQLAALLAPSVRPSGAGTG